MNVSLKGNNLIPKQNLLTYKQIGQIYIYPKSLWLLQY